MDEVEGVGGGGGDCKWVVLEAVGEVMYLMTAHRTYVVSDSSGKVFQLTHPKSQSGIYPVFIDNFSANDSLIKDGPLKGHEIIRAGDSRIHLRKEGLYLCALVDSSELVTNRKEAKEWETFWLVSADEMSRLQSHGTPQQEIQRLKHRISVLVAGGKPVKLQFGVGPNPRTGFLNIDKHLMATEFSMKHPDDYFIFPFADMNWGIPDNCVDYIFHEDFIEHIDQTNQFQFLAEALRVLKPGCWHRVNTPDLLWSMKTHSDFKRGLDGVYTGERQWGHISLLTHSLLAEMARIVGYSEVVFTTRGHGVSPYSEADLRPLEDRDSIVGNIFADLLKR